MAHSFALPVPNLGSAPLSGSSSRGRSNVRLVHSRNWRNLKCSDPSVRVPCRGCCGVGGKEVGLEVVGCRLGEATGHPFCGFGLSGRESIGREVGLFPQARGIDGQRIGGGMVVEVCRLVEPGIVVVDGRAVVCLALSAKGYTVFVCFFFEVFLIPALVALVGPLLLLPLVLVLFSIGMCVLGWTLRTLVGVVRYLWKARAGRPTVLKFQVGLMGRIDTLELEVKHLFNAFAEPHHMLTDAIIALLRYSDYFIAADHSVYRNKDMVAVEEKFTYYSLEERGMRDESWEEFRPSGFRSGYRPPTGEDERFRHLVVTVVVVAKGNRKLVEMKEAKDIEENLKQLGCIKADTIQNVGVFCTPFSDQFKMALKYPNLKYF